MDIMEMLAKCWAFRWPRKKEKKKEEEKARGSFTDVANIITEYYETTMYGFKVLFKDGLVIPSEFNILRLPMIPLQMCLKMMEPNEL
uniref:NR LBD domain-containing protein n=1 Tax=Caenorhabditis tropicalis TaxID=1561998 RepID=A0A1I7TMN8_9PELO